MASRTPTPLAVEIAVGCFVRSTGRCHHAVGRDLLHPVGLGQSAIRETDVPSRFLLGCGPVCVRLWVCVAVVRRISVLVETVKGDSNGALCSGFSCPGFR
jgi:hypothetical protein